MAMNRVINSIWAEISAWGSLIKTATNPYHPNPGADTVGANNQGLAAITGPSPFIKVDKNGISPDIQVSTSLADIGNVSPTPLDENSGACHVVRQYGDIYMYNDGNIISWGGNGKNLSFGNSYEENHGWANQASVYNNETFHIPPGAMYSSATKSSVPAVPETDLQWLGGTVSKSWGVEFNYSYGSSYEWSSGPNQYIDAFGSVGDDLTDVKQGKHCTYSYGTGYEETLVSWDLGSGWFHADDSNSPYASRKHDSWQSPYLSLETVATSFASGGAPTPGGFLGSLLAGNPELEAAYDEVYNPQDFAQRNTWTASNLLVSKTFGNTYDYHYGPGLSIQEGPSEERNYGNSSSTVVGNSVESVTGNSTSTVTGNSSETVTGNATSMVQGNATEQFWGGKAEFFMGGKSEMILGAADEITLSVKMEIKTLGAIEVFGGVSVATFLGLLIEVQAGGKFEFGELKLKNHVAEVDVKDAAKVQVAGAAQIQSAPVNVTTP